MYLHVEPIIFEKIFLMATIIIMPKQGQSVESCIITEINKKKGDKVSKGDILFAYETDKASFEEVSPVDGFLLEFFFNEGDEVPVLTNICVIVSEGEKVEKFRPGNDFSKEEKTIVTKSSIEDKFNKVSEPQVVSTGRNVTGISPRARKLTDKKAIDISALPGSGPGGRLIERDIQAASETAPKLTPLAKKMVQQDSTLRATSGTGLFQNVTGNDLLSNITGSDFEIKPISNMRKLIAKTMLSSLQNSAQLTHHLGADASRLNELRKKVKNAVEEGYAVNITLNDMICYAAIKALKKFPQVNAHFLGDNMKLFSKVHLGLAVDTDRGLMVPVVKNADNFTIQELSTQFKKIADTCRKGNISPELLTGDAASFTVSNLGNYGVEMFTPVINLPQVAILGVNTIVLRPKELGDGLFGFVPYLGLSLTYDHRAIDGGEATRFVKQIANEIENLEFEL